MGTKTIRYQRAPNVTKNVTKRTKNVTKGTKNFNNQSASNGTEMFQREQ